MSEVKEVQVNEPETQPKVERPFHLVHKSVPTALKPFMGTIERARAYYDVVHLRRQNGTSEIHATNGRALVSVKEKPTLDGSGVRSNIEPISGNVNVSFTALNDVAKALPKVAFPAYEYVVVARTAQGNALVTDALGEISKKDITDIVYPDIDAVQPKGEPLAYFYVNPDLLAKVLNIYAKLHEGRGDPMVRIEVRGSLKHTDRAIVIRSVGEEREVMSLVMPMTNDDDPVPSGGEQAQV